MTGGTIVALVPLAIGAISLAGAWLTFEKANRAGWKAIIPIYNLYVMLKIGDNEWWWLLVLFVPIVQLYATYKMLGGVSKAFGKGTGFALGMTFLPFIFFPLLGFGDARYQGGSESRAATGGV